MRLFCLTLTLLLLTGSLACADAAAPMRPYSGIGVLQLSSVGVPDQIPLYDQPGVARCCKLDIEAIKELNAWLFGNDQEPHMLVTAQKGDWLEVELDTAGRTGWIRRERRWLYQPWEQFLKGRLVLFLRNSPRKQMQVLAKAGAQTGTPLQTRQPMRVIRTQDDWAYALLDQSSAGWIRWRDQDGRLLVGFDSSTRK